MKTLNSLSQAVPLQFDLAALLPELKGQWQQVAESIQGTNEAIKKAKAAAKQVKQAIDTFEQVLEEPNWDEKASALFSAIEQALPLVGKADSALQQKILSSKEYLLYQELQDTWTTLSTPIGKQTKTIEESLDYTKGFASKNVLNKYPNADLKFGLNLKAEASFKLSVMSKDDAQKGTGIVLADKSVLVNQELKAMLSTTAEAKGSFHAIALGAKAYAKGELEIDSYFQANSSSKTYQVLYDMYKQPLLPWDLENMALVLESQDVNGDANGYRGLSLMRDISIGLSGSIGVGKSISTISDVNNQPVDIDISAALTLSRSLAMRGKIEVFITKNTQGDVVVSVSTLDNKNNASGIDLTLGAGIKGLDKIVRPQVEKLLGEGNKLVKLLEKNSTPGQDLVDSLLKDVSDDLWLKPMAKVLLGEESTDAAVKTMINDEIKEVFDRSILSTTRDANDLADSALAKLLDVFGVNLDSGTPLDSTLEQAKNKASKTLATEIKKLQSKASDAAEQINQAIKTKALDELKPLAKLGTDIGQAIDNFDGDITRLFEKAIKRYQEFSKKIADALEKAANIQLSLQYQSNTEEMDLEEDSFSIVLKKPKAHGVRKLYQSIVLGDDKTTSALLAALSQSGDIIYQPNSLKLQKLIKGQVSLGINVIGYSTTSKTDVVSDLVVNVGPNGRVELSHAYNVKTFSEGFSEKRNALFDLSYGLAQASLGQAVNGALGLSYSNQDSKLHNVKEMNQFLDSLTLADLDSRLKSQGFKPIATVKEVKDAKKIFKNYTTSAGSSTAKFLPNNSHSAIAITMRASQDIYNQLMSLNADALFNKAFITLLYSDNRRKRRDMLINIIAGYQELNATYLDISKLYDNLSGDDGGIRRFEIKTRMQETEKYNAHFGYCDNDDWREATQRLERYFLQAAAFRAMPNEFRTINNYVTNLPEQVDKASAKELLAQLTASNHRIENHLDKWIKVNSALTDLINDLFTSLGFKVGGLNSTLLLFMVLLQDAMNSDDLYLVRIDLERNDGANRKVIAVS